MAFGGTTDEDLVELLRSVQIGYLVEKKFSFDEELDWSDTLSGGEKQCVAMARLFYHAPQFAILDECTSSLSLDLESFLYTRCRELGITLFTVAHRKTVWQYHEYVLEMNGKGGYSFRELDN